MRLRVGWRPWGGTGRPETLDAGHWSLTGRRRAGQLLPGKEPLTPPPLALALPWRWLPMSPLEECGTQLASGAAACSPEQCLTWIPGGRDWETQVRRQTCASMARGWLLPEAGPSLPPGPPRRPSAGASGPSTAAAAGQGQARSPHLAHSGQRLCQPEGELPALAGLGHDSPRPCRHGVGPSQGGTKPGT